MDEETALVSVINYMAQKMLGNLPSTYTRQDCIRWLAAEYHNDPQVRDHIDKQANRLRAACPHYSEAIH